MSDYDERTYGATWGAFYDDLYPSVEDSTIDLLRVYTGTPGRALELAIGTGRIALPLAARGVEVTGIDISEEMVDRLRAKSQGETVEVVMGDFADVDVPGSFPLVYLTFNTLFALLTQERQVDCFRNVALHLEPGGRFVLDCFVPDLKLFDEYNTRLGVSSISSTTEHAYEMSVHDPVNQRVMSHHVRRLSTGEEVTLPVEIRYAWPAEMDLMAQMAGLTLEERWGWYDRRPFTETSRSHVSVYRKPR